MDFNIEAFVQKYDVHPETVNFLHAAAASGTKPYYEIGVEAARQFSIERNEKLAGTIDFEGSEEEIIVPSEDVKGKAVVIFLGFRLALSVPLNKGKPLYA